MKREMEVDATHTHTNALFFVKPGRLDRTTSFECVVLIFPV
jgi:hypothetical protein